ncbi:hypothetical protein JXB41_04180 [Candidatus Woesearchaeota archaeon]|nr:hypothetical protein [Candidatus Woesearchaeota archaeon]
MLEVIVIDAPFLSEYTYYGEYGIGSPLGDLAENCFKFEDRQRCWVIDEHNNNNWTICEYSYIKVSSLLIAVQPLCTFANNQFLKGLDDVFPDFCNWIDPFDDSNLRPSPSIIIQSESAEKVISKLRELKYPLNIKKVNLEEAIHHSSHTVDP